VPSDLIESASDSGPDAHRVKSLDGLGRELGLLRARAAHGTRAARVSIDELSRRVDQPRSTVHAYVTGKYLPPSAALDSIVIALGASPVEQRQWNNAWFRVAADVERRRRTRTDAATTGPPVGADVPHQLPSEVDHFTGRDPELAELDKILGSNRDPHDPVAIAAVTGIAGVGKTALAVRWARRATAHFPDGELYLDLRGYDPDQPRGAGEALGILLRALGRDGKAIPFGADERAALFRSVLANRRMLVLLDNADDVEQVRPLLPGAGTSAVLVTSRDQLAGLVVRHGAHRIDLDVLPSSDAHDLLRRLIGDRVDKAVAASAQVASLCGYLPLTLRIAAERVVAHPARSLAWLASNLADERRRLDLLDADDPRTAVRSVFSWSYRHLDAVAALAFRRLGMLPGADVDEYALGALTDDEPQTARRTLDRLARANLAHEVGSGRFAQHDLLRVFAAELAAAEPEPQRRRSLNHLFDHYLSASSLAVDALYPFSRHRRPRVPDAVRTSWHPTDESAARRWLENEQRNLVAASDRMAKDGRSEHVVTLAATLRRHLELTGHYSAAQAINGHALTAAERSGDSAGQAAARAGLANLDWHAGDLDAARDNLTAARALYRRAGDRHGEMRTVSNLGLILQQSGKYARAIEHYRAALSFFREIDDLLGAGEAMFGVGRAQARMGSDREAAEHFIAALELYRQIDNRPGQAGVLIELGNVESRSSRYGEALDHLQTALDICRVIGSEPGEAEALVGLGTVYQQMRRYREAVECLERSLELNVDNDADLSRAPGPARGNGRRTPTADRYQDARARECLGDAYRALGDLDQARAHWRRALVSYDAMEVPEAEAVRGRLAQQKRETRTPPRDVPTT